MGECESVLSASLFNPSHIHPLKHAGHEEDAVCHRVLGAG